LAGELIFRIGMTRITSFSVAVPGSEPGTARAIIRARDLGRTLQRTVRFTRTSAEELDAPLQHAIPGTGISDVAQVVFVRKRLVEIQYLRTTITDERRHEFGHLVGDTIRRIESAEFLPHSGIRFPQNPCSSCPYVGLCLDRKDLAAAALVRRPGAEDWLA
jgi:hypothetical protein